MRMRLAPIAADAYGIGAWVGNDRREDKGPAEKAIIDARANGKLFIHAFVEDEDACYSYDEMAVVSIGKDHYLLQTSGCSCPSPAETWEVVFGPTTKSAVREFIEQGKYQGYTLPEKMVTRLLKDLEA